MRKLTSLDVDDRHLSMKILCSFLLAIALLGDGNAQATPPGLTLHRIQAGTLDESGWTHAGATLGAFELQIPCLYNDFTIEDLAANSSVKQTFTVGCLRQDQRRFLVTRVQYRSGETDARAFFEKSGDIKEWPERKIVRSTFLGLDAIDFSFNDQKTCGFVRLVHVPPETVLMLAEAPMAECDGLDAMKKFFLGSLIILSR